ncbi:MAG: alpha/beta hydrolase [Myxococcales bacterium]|nr:alpha/beta hydrolase [Myxococcales bacterium]
MPKAFVHGVPETAAIWRTLAAELEQRGSGDLVFLSPPGFGAAVPAGWEPTQTHYASWLIGELEALGGDVDLVGHDWGAGHLGGVLAERPDLLRSWALDCAGLFHPEYVWHDMAQAWQTPNVGEQAIGGLIGGSAEERSALMAGLGLPADVAATVAAGQDAEMARCILGLYRSAAQPAMRELGERMFDAKPPPGLVIIPADDTYPGTPEMAAEVAARLGAGTKTLDGLDHWWMFEGAAAVAEALVAHWKLEETP